MRLQNIHSAFWKKTIVVIVSVLLTALFLYASYNKLAIYSTFVDQLKVSPVTSKFAFILAWAVPGVEIAIAIGLWINKTRILALYSAFYLMLAFTIYVYIIPHFFKQQVCSCGGIINSFSWKQHFWFNLAFTLLAGIGLVLSTVLKTSAQKASHRSLQNLKNA